MNGNVLKMFNQGYTDLIPLSGKAPILTNWTQHVATQAEAEAWDAQNINVGLLAKRFPGIDCDITDFKLSMAVRGIAREVFGTKCPIRVGKPPKWLLVTRLPEGAAPLRKRTLTFSKGDVTYSIEMLGDGQQYVVDGIHPDTGKPYFWEGTPITRIENGKKKTFSQSWPQPPVNWAASDVPAITPEKIDTFITRVTEYFIERGWTAGSETSKTAGPAIDPEQLYAPSLEVIRSAVAAIPNTENTTREQYVGIAHMVKGACRPEWEADGEEIFVAWAGRWPGSVDAEEDRRVWTSLKRDHLRSGWGLIRELAERNGWHEAVQVAQQEAQDAFDVVDDILPAPPVLPGLTLDEAQDEWLLSRYVLVGMDSEIFTSGDNDWFNWNGQIWAPDNTNNEHAKGRIGRRLHLVAEELTQRYPQGGRQVVNVIRKVHSTKMVSTMFTRAAQEEWLYRNRDMVNNTAMVGYMLSTPHGVYDLRTRELMPHNPLHYITQMTRVSPAFEAGCPVWLQFLLSSCDGDVSRIEYMQAVLGSALTADTSERLIWFLTGPSGAGKSTLLKTIHHILGDYAGIVPDGALVSGGDRAHTSAIAGFRDKRFLHGSEIDRGNKWNVSLLKSVTGNEEIAARRLYHSYETFRVVGKIIIAGNETPTLPNVDSAVKARLRIIPFTTPEEPDLHLDQKLMQEAAAILAWVMEGAYRWLESGYPHCSAVESLTDEYIVDEDFITQFRDSNFLVTGNQHHFAAYDEIMALWNQFMPLAQQRDFGLNNATALGKALRTSDPRITLDQRRIEGRVRRGLKGLMFREEATERLSVEDLL